MRKMGEVSCPSVRRNANKLVIFSANKPNGAASGGGSSDGPSRGAGAAMGGASSGGPPMGLGGLFSGGMPKLKPTGQRSALGVSRGGGDSSSPSPPKESPPKETPSPSRQMGSVNQTLAQAIANQAAKLNPASDKVSCQHRFRTVRLSRDSNFVITPCSRFSDLSL